MQCGGAGDLTPAIFPAKGLGAPRLRVSDNQINTGTKCFLFQRTGQGSPTDLGFALVPTSSDTVNEAINAFIASAATVTAMEDIAARNQYRAQLLKDEANQ